MQLTEQDKARVLAFLEKAEHVSMCFADDTSSGPSKEIGVSLTAWFGEGALCEHCRARASNLRTMTLGQSDKAAEAA